MSNLTSTQARRRTVIRAAFWGVILTVGLWLNITGLAAIATSGS